MNLGYAEPVDGRQQQESGTGPFGGAGRPHNFMESGFYGNDTFPDTLTSTVAPDVD